MPVQTVILTFRKPVPIHIVPYSGNIPAKLFLRPVSHEIGTGDEQSFYQERGLHDIRPVVFRTESDGLPRLTVQPMRESPVKPVALRLILQEGDNLCQALHRLFAGNPSTLRTYHDGGNAKATASGSNRSIFARIPFQSESGHGMGIVPHIVECILLELIQQVTVFQVRLIG